MKSALVCIAKDEDLYIDEWISYHTKLGFDAIYVYQNNWRFCGDKSKYENVVWVEFDGQAMQKAAYDDFIDKHRREYDWAAFFDVDEYLVLKRRGVENVNDELSLFDDVELIGVPWRLFGSNGQDSGHKTGNFSMVDRFTRRQRNFSVYKKLIVNLKLSNESFKFVDPHYMNGIVAIDTTKRIKTSTSLFPSEIEDSDQTMELFHYIQLTKDERFRRKSCGDVFFGDEHGRKTIVKENMERWDSLDGKYNEVEDLSAYNFKHGLCT